MYYKVVEDIDGVLYSSWLGKKGCEYKVGVPTKQKSHCGPLAVFANIEGARDYIETFGGVIYRCSIVISRTKGLWNRKRIYTNSAKNKTIVSSWDTVYAKEVTLVSITT